MDELKNLRIIAFESRRSSETAELIRRYGGEPVSAPAVREVPIDPGAARDFARRLDGGRVDVVIFLTGVGTNLLIDAVAPVMPRQNLSKALTAITTVARGPKTISALRGLGVTPSVIVPEPSTWHELLSSLDTHSPVRDRNVAVQEYGEENPELIGGLSERGANVIRVPVYRWELPEDLGPLRNAVEEIIAGRVHIAMFTSAVQPRHLFRVAGPELAGKLRQGLRRIVVASIGPVCTEGLRKLDVQVDLEPEHSKLGHLFITMAARARSILSEKNALP